MVPVENKSLLTRARILGAFTAAYWQECRTDEEDPLHPKYVHEDAQVYGTLHMDEPFGRGIFLEVIHTTARTLGLDSRAMLTDAANSSGRIDETADWQVKRVITLFVDEAKREGRYQEAELS